MYILWNTEFFFRKKYEFVNYSWIKHSLAKIRKECTMCRVGWGYFGNQFKTIYYKKKYPARVLRAKLNKGSVLNCLFMHREN